MELLKLDYWDKVPAEADVATLEFLRTPCQPVKAVEDARPVIEAMRSWCVINAASLAGLSAPQFGVGLRVCIVWLRGIEAVMINPEVVYEKGQQTGQEGCLSFPGVRVLVQRPKIVKVRYLNEAGEQRSIKGHELTAVAIKHEVDHLDGKVIVDYLKGEGRR